MAGLEELPPWAQVVASLVVAIVAVSAWLSGIVRRVGPPAPPKDAVVLGSAIADSAALRSLADAIRDLRATLVERDGRLREHQRDVVHELRVISDHLERMQHRQRAPRG